MEGVLAQTGGLLDGNRLSTLERVMGIEPTRSAWKAEVLPLNYTRVFVVSTGRLDILQHEVSLVHMWRLQRLW